LRFAGPGALFLLGLCALLVDYLKHGGAITSWLPQTEAWDRINVVAFTVESFLGYNLGNLLPWHLSAIVGILLICAGIFWIVRSRSSTSTMANHPTTKPPNHPTT
jgi:hypothetical protein